MLQHNLKSGSVKKHVDHIKHLQIANKIQVVCWLTEYNFNLYQNQFINTKFIDIVILFIFIYAIDFQKVNKLSLIA